MNELFEKLGIDNSRGVEGVIEQLRQKQVEYLERLDNATDKKGGNSSAASCRQSRLPLPALRGCSREPAAVLPGMKRI